MDLPHLILGRITLKRSSSVFAAPVRIPHNCEFPFAIAHFAKGSGLWAWRDLQLHAKISIILHPRSCHRYTAKVLKKLLKKTTKKNQLHNISRYFKPFCGAWTNPEPYFTKLIYISAPCFCSLCPFPWLCIAKDFLIFFFFSEIEIFLAVTSLLVLRNTPTLTRSDLRCCFFLNLFFWWNHSCKPKDLQAGKGLYWSQIKGGTFQTVPALRVWTPLPSSFSKLHPEALWNYSGSVESVFT